MNNEYLAWYKKILCFEDLEDWEITWESNKTVTEGLTLFDSKTIKLYGDVYPALALHEIAHAKLGEAGHDSMFSHHFMYLVNRWMKPNKGSDE